jgi:hypothetical protein
MMRHDRPIRLPNLCLRLFPLFCALIGFHCLQDNPGQNSHPVAPRPSGVLEYSYSFVRTQDFLFYTWYDSAYKCACADTALVCSSFVQNRTDTVAYFVTRNLLGIENGVDTNPGFADPTAAIRWYIGFVREGSGSGLTGLWRADHWEYRVIRGVLTSDEIAFLEALIAMPGTQQDFQDQYGEIEVEFSGATWRIYGAPVCHADVFIDQWNALFNGYDAHNADSARFDIVVTKLSCDSIRLFGNKNTETVDIAWNAAGDMSYGSSDTTHHAYTWYVMPQTCPNEYAPEWYENAFLIPNLKSLAKAGVSDRRPQLLPTGKRPAWMRAIAAAGSAYWR